MEILDKKKSGSIYTPYELGYYMAEKMFEQKELDKIEEYTVLDPACGEGDLLIAAYDCAVSKGISVKLIGFDTNKEALRIADSNLKNKKFDNYELIAEDFLDYVLNTSYENQLTLFSEGKDTLYVDMVLANPPYVRTQVMGAEKSKQLAKSFNLKGKIDMYHAFYAALSYVMKDEGVLSIITSNKFLNNKSGESLRKLLLDNYRIEEVIDLGDTKLFDAAVLPAIIVAQKDRSIRQKNAKFISLYETSNTEINDNFVESKSIYDILKSEAIGNYRSDSNLFSLRLGHIIFPVKDKEPWILATDDEFRWVNLVKKKFAKRILDLGKIRVGIKTTADNVFIKETWEEIDENKRPEEELIHDLFSSSNAVRWVAPNEGYKKILYPHIKGDGKKKSQPIDLEKFPKTKEYLLDNFQQLDGRSYVKKAKRKWFEIWVPQDPVAWKKEKIIFPDISEFAKFCYDDKGLYVDGNCYWFTTYKDVDPNYLFLVLGVANSSVLKRYHEICFQNKLYSNKYRYLTQYVEQYPIPEIDLPESKQIIEIVKKIIETTEVKTVEKYEDE
ncbi:N-6 DNA methylase, partial [Enterococcus faecium]|nr:N-6 DNA methylase [Enterococcus faecium]